MATMEMDPNLKTSGRFVHVFVLVSQIKLVKTDFARFFFQISRQFVSLAV